MFASGGSGPIGYAKMLQKSKLFINIYLNSLTAQVQLLSKVGGIEMINTVIIRGLFEFVQQLILVAIAKDLPVKLVVATGAEEAPRYQALVTASLTCRQFTLVAQAKPDYSQADSLIIGNLVPLASDRDASGDLKATLPLFRAFVNDAMGAGFNGKIILAGSNDAVLSLSLIHI